MDRFKKHEILATIYVAVFIICAAVFLLVQSDKVLGICAKNLETGLYVATGSDAEIHTSNDARDEAISQTNSSLTVIDISENEARLYFEQLVFSFRSFWSSDYEISGYQISTKNVGFLNDLKVLYRIAVIFGVLCLVGMIYSFSVLSKRRILTPFMYGGFVATAFTAISMFGMMLQKHGFFADLKRMILLDDYSCLDTDILRSIIPQSFALHMCLAYIVLVLIWVLVMNLIRWIILFNGRPHRF